MRSLLVGLSLLCLVSIHAQTPAERFLAAEQQWKSHRPDGSTWNDGSPAAAQALDAMWTAITEDANEYILVHPSASAAEIKAHLEQITPVTDPRFGNDLSASVAQLGQNLYAISFSVYPASTVFVLRPGAVSGAWRINTTTAQAHDDGNLLRAWHNDRADGKCRDREPENAWDTCGPLTSSLGILPRSSTGAPRFFVSANYSKDAGVSVVDQISIWEWEGSVPALLWIHNYIEHLEVTRPVQVRGALLTFGEQDQFKSFLSCSACDSRQMLHTVTVTPDGVKDLGRKALYPEIDRIDQLIFALLRKKPTRQLASPEAAQALARELRASGNPGILEDWSVLKQVGGTERLCFSSDGLPRWNFTFGKQDADTYYVLAASQEEPRASNPCPKKGALRKPYKSVE